MRFNFSVRDLIASRPALLVLLSVVLLVITNQMGFFNRRAHITHDTITYANLPGFSVGFGLSNFSSELRTPGFSLFMALVTFGKIPRPNVITFKFCGTTLFSEDEPCETVTPDKTDTIVRMPPVIYGYDKETTTQLQTVVVTTKILFSMSFLALFWALSFHVQPSLAAISVVSVLVLAPLNFIEGAIQTELLFPALGLAYVSCWMMYFVKLKAKWLALSSLLAVMCLFVRPVFLYLILVQFVFLLFVAVKLRRVAAMLVATVVLLAPVLWLFTFSPVKFFSVADDQSAALRTAIISDATTVQCIKEPDLKIILAAYIKSIYDPSLERMSYLDRYYKFANANVYRLNLPNHPIYRQPEIQSFQKPLPPADIDRMLLAAGKCNFWRNFDYMLQSTAAMLGLTTEQLPQVYPAFFRSPCIFYIASFSIGVSVLLLLLRRKYYVASIILISLTVYFCMVLIVALKQGADSRYTGIVEPLFVLGLAISCSVLCAEIVNRISGVLQRDRVS